MTTTPATSATKPHVPRRGGRGLRHWFLLPKLTCLLLFIGGLGALAAVALFAPEPDTLEGWRAVRGIVRTLVLCYILPGVLGSILFGILLFVQFPAVFRRLRWFRLKLALVAVGIPVAHLWARGRVEAFDAAIEGGDLATIASAWGAVALPAIGAFVLFLLIGAIGRVKPRLAERFGSRRQDRR